MGGLLSTVYFYVISKTVFRYKVIFFSLVLILYSSYFYTAFRNPGIVINKIRDSLNYYSCSSCQVFYSPNDLVQHCEFCKVCVKNMDHHCIWMSKCVGKNNKFSFYFFICFVMVTYIYLIIIVIAFQIKGKLN